MKRLLLILPFLFSLVCLGQTAAPTPHTEDISGMYTFLQEGEFVQIDVNGSSLSGYVSRYGDLDSDKGAFLDHVFKEGDLKGDKVHFVTRQVHGVWFEFDGTASLGNEKDPNKEGYRILKGKLTQYKEGASDKPEAKSREITMKSFPMNEIIGKSR
jgi:hypothetical protein